MLMTNDAERAEYYHALAGRVISFASGSLKRDAADQINGIENARDDHATAARSINPLGGDVDQPVLEEIEALASGKLGELDPYREAQIRELGFWRWVAYEGYDKDDPRLFPLHQELQMVEMFYRTGWSLSDFADSKVIELGCGPLGPIEFIPARERVAFDPLNNHYSRLFSRCRSTAVTYITERQELESQPADFDFAICHDVIDHTSDPAYWFDTLFAKLKSGGRFLFQVGLSRPDVPRTEEYRAMHPSPFVEAQAMAWLKAKSDDFSFKLLEEPRGGGEVSFFSWGRKTCNADVQYESKVSITNLQF